MGASQRENWRVKTQIIEALLRLMEEKPLEEIYVTDITRRANVSRQSYYRNFGGKQAIIDAFYEAIRRETLFGLMEKPGDYGGERMICELLEVLRRHRREVLTLHRSGLSGPILENINQTIEMAAGDMSAGSPQRYWLYAFAGAIYNTAIIWLAEGAKEPAQSVAQVLSQFHAGEMVFFEGRRDRIQEALGQLSGGEPFFLPADHERT